MLGSLVASLVRMALQDRIDPIVAAREHKIINECNTRFTQAAFRVIIALHLLSYLVQNHKFVKR